MNVTDTTWRDLAACKGEDPNLFFSDLRRDLNKAVAICHTCPVSDPCRKDGKGEKGIWGGVGEKRRPGGKGLRTVLSGPVEPCLWCARPSRRPYCSPYCGHAIKEERARLAAVAAVWWARLDRYRENYAELVAA